MDRVKGKVALVTGGAMGMGKTHSETLAAEGAMVFVTDLNEEGGKAVVKGIQDAGGKAEFIKRGRLGKRGRDDQSQGRQAGCAGQQRRYPDPETRARDRAG